MTDLTASRKVGAELTDVTVSRTVRWAELTDVTVRRTVRWA